MDQLDRLGWAAGASLTAHGVSVGVRASGSQALDDALAALPFHFGAARAKRVQFLYSFVEPAQMTRPGVRGFHLVYGGAGRIARTLDRDQALKLLGADAELAVAAWSPRFTFVHAGVVGWQGRAIVIPGASGSGKSSLVLSLVRAGATYYSDEFALIDERGRVHAYPRPIGLRERPGDLPTPRSIESLGGRQGVRPLPVGLVLLTGYSAGARTRLREVTEGDALMGLMANTVSARTQPERALAALAEVAAAARSLRGRRGEADDVAERVLRLASDAATLPASRPATAPSGARRAAARPHR